MECVGEFAQQESIENIVLLNEDLTKYIHETFVESYPIQETILPFGKNIKQFEKHVEKYSLIALKVKEGKETGPDEKWGGLIYAGNNRRFNVAIDTPSGIALSYEGFPIAILGLSQEDETLKIHQFEGVNPYKCDDMQRLIVNSKTRMLQRSNPRGLELINWKEFFTLALSKTLGIELGAEELSIISIYNHPFLNGNESDNHIPLERGLRLYDSTAKNLGFKQKEDKNWYKRIDEL